MLDFVEEALDEIALAIGQCGEIWPSIGEGPLTSPRSTAAGTSATIAAAPARQSRHQHRSPELHRRLEFPTNNFHEKEIAAAPPRRPDQIERVSLGASRAGNRWKDG